MDDMNMYFEIRVLLFEFVLDFDFRNLSFNHERFRLYGHT